MAPHKNLTSRPRSKFLWYIYASPDDTRCPCPCCALSNYSFPGFLFSSSPLTRRTLPWATGYDSSDTFSCSSWKSSRPAQRYICETGKRCCSSLEVPRTKWYARTLSRSQYSRISWGKLFVPLFFHHFVMDQLVSPSRWNCYSSPDHHCCNGGYVLSSIQVSSLN